MHDLLLEIPKVLDIEMKQMLNAIEERWSQRLLQLQRKRRVGATL